MSYELGQVAIEMGLPEDELYESDIELAARIGQMLLRKNNELEIMVDECHEIIGEKEEQVAKLVRDQKVLRKMYEDGQEEVIFLEEKLENLSKHIELLEIENECEIKYSNSLDKHNSILEAEIKRLERQKDCLEDTVKTLTMDLEIYKSKLEEDIDEVLLIEVEDFESSASEVESCEVPVITEKVIVEDKASVIEDLICRLKNNVVIINQHRDAISKYESQRDNYSPPSISNCDCSRLEDKSIYEEIIESDDLNLLNKECITSGIDSSLKEIKINLMSKYDILDNDSDFERKNMATQTMGKFIEGCFEDLSKVSCLQFFLGEDTLDEESGKSDGGAIKSSDTSNSVNNRGSCTNTKYSMGTAKNAAVLEDNKENMTESFDYFSGFSRTKSKRSSKRKSKPVSTEVPSLVGASSARTNKKTISIASLLFNFESYRETKLSKRPKPKRKDDSN